MLLSAKQLMGLSLHVYNFNMLYDTYKDWYAKTESAGSRGLLYNFALSLDAFERLIEKGLFKYDSVSAAKGLKQFRMVKSVLHYTEIEKVVKEFGTVLPDTMIKWTSY